MSWKQDRLDVVIKAIEDGVSMPKIIIFTQELCQALVTTFKGKCPQPPFVTVNVSLDWLDVSCCFNDHDDATHFHVHGKYPNPHTVENMNAVAEAFAKFLHGRWENETLKLYYKAVMADDKDNGEPA